MGHDDEMVPQSIGLFSSLQDEPEESLALLSFQDRNESEKRTERIQQRNESNPNIKRNRMTQYQTFFAIIKAYTTMNVFLLPIGFKEGGWLFSPIVLIISCFLEASCAIRLCSCAHKVQIYQYPDLVEYAFGRTAKVIFQIGQAFLNFTFTLTMLSFFVKTLVSVSRVATGVEIDPMVYIFIAVLILAPLSWIRHVERFSIGFVFAVIVILLMVVTLVVYESNKLYSENNEAGPNWTAFNQDKYYIMISLSFYMFEGIGSLLPVMEASDVKDSFGWLIGCALATLCLLHIAFSELSYYTFGDDLNEPVLIEELPEAHPWVIIAKILFCIQILISYPLTIYITNNIIEQLIFSQMAYSQFRKWLKNLSRTIIATSAVFLGFSCYKNLHKILGFTGIVLGAWLVLITPSFIHNKIAQPTGYARCFNYFVIIYAIVMGLIFGTLIIVNWNLA